MGVAAYHVAGRSSDAAALLAAGAKRARSLVYVGPSERPVNLPVMAVSGVYGDPTSIQAAPDISGSSRSVVLLVRVLFSIVFVYRLVAMAHQQHLAAQKHIPTLSRTVGRLPTASCTVSCPLPAGLLYWRMQTH
jgi:hypothetical protein